MQAGERYIPLDRIYATENNRESFDAAKMQQLADSIRSRYERLGDGIIQAITVRETDQGYLLVAGERRTRASRLAGMSTIRARVLQLSDKDAYIDTLEENNNRDNVTPIEESNGYWRYLNDLGGTIGDLIKATGRTRAYIERRLALRDLSPQLRELVDKGIVGLTYAEAMAHLDHNRQSVALRELRNNANPNMVWFTEVVKRLYAQQLAESQLTMFDMASVPVKVEAGDRPVVAMPRDPADYAPTFDPGDMLGDCKRQLATWREAGQKWAALGYTDKSRECEAIVATLAALVAALPSVRVDQDASSKIMRIFANGESYTTAEVYRMANVSRNEAQPALLALVANGQLRESVAGRGKRYTRA